MNKPSANSIKKYLTALNKIKVKYVTTERLSKVVGVYPEIIADNLSYFDPMAKLDDTFDVRSITEQMKEYIKPKAKAVKDVKPKQVIKQTEVLEYESVNDFFIKKFTIGGFVNGNTKLTDKDLKILAKLIKLEQMKKRR